MPADFASTLINLNQTFSLWEPKKEGYTNARVLTLASIKRPTKSIYQLHQNLFNLGASIGRV